MAKILITGGTGCIGATTVHQLLQEFDDSIDQIHIASRSGNTDHLRIWFDDQLQPLIDQQRIVFAKVDIGDADSIHRSLHECQPTHVIHLGALQSPDCASDPQRGMQVNLGGTMNLLEAVGQLSKPLERFVFASSAAVYGKRTIYPASTVGENDRLAPPNLYGVWKVAGEHLAALFHETTEIPTVCLRLNTTYGPGRDRGMTSAPTRVMQTIVNGSVRGKREACLMPYQGRENYHFVTDVGAHFAAVCMQPFAGFQAFNIKGQTIPVQQFLDWIGQAATELGLGDFVETGIAPDATENLFVCDLDDRKIDSFFQDLPRTDLQRGIHQTFRKFLELARDPAA